MTAVLKRVLVEKRNLITVSYPGGPSAAHALEARSYHEPFTRLPQSMPAMRTRKGEFDVA
jgi:hypothetical protein